MNNQEFVFLTEDEIVLYDPELAGLFKSIKKAFKKVVKVVKKVAPYAAAGAALYFGGPIAAKVVGGMVGKIGGAAREGYARTSAPPPVVYGPPEAPPGGYTAYPAAGQAVYALPTTGAGLPGPQPVQPRAIQYHPDGTITAGDKIIRGATVKAAAGAGSITDFIKSPAGLMTLGVGAVFVMSAIGGRKAA